VWRARSAFALIISKWAGHYDSSFTMKTYVHATDDDLKQGRQALAKMIHHIG
jgi:integrase